MLVDTSAASIPGDHEGPDSKEYHDGSKDQRGWNHIRGRSEVGAELMAHILIPDCPLGSWNDDKLGSDSVQYTNQSENRNSAKISRLPI